MANITDPHVLIVGGGIGGLALAHGLKKHNISFHVYERDRTQAYRAQGYRVRIRNEAVEALREVLDTRTMDNFELSCAKFNVEPIPEIDAETGRVDMPNIGDIPEGTEEEIAKAITSARCVDRGALRDVLIKGLSPEDVSYDKVFERYVETTNSVAAHFADGSSAYGTLLVGADGNSSRVRKQLLPQLEPANTGMRCLYGKTPLSADLQKQIEPYAGHSMSFIKDRSSEDILIAGLEPITFGNHAEREARGLLQPPDYIFWAISAPSLALGLPQDEYTHLSCEDSEQKALQVSKGWHPALRAIVEQQQKGETLALTIRAIKPGMPSWEANEHVTMLGDAVHPMAPTGSGAVTALQDAALLSRLIHEKGQSQTTIGEFEEAMRENVVMPVETSWGAIQGMSGMKRKNEFHMGEMAMRIRMKNVQR